MNAKANSILAVIQKTHICLGYLGEFLKWIHCMRLVQWAKLSWKEMTSWKIINVYGSKKNFLEVEGYWILDYL